MGGGQQTAFIKAIYLICQLQLHFPGPFYETSSINHILDKLSACLSVRFHFTLKFSFPSFHHVFYDISLTSMIDSNGDLVYL